MARAKRKQHTLAKVHDRRSKDLPRNAEVAPIEVDDPLAQEAGEKIVTMRSLRNDPLGRLHSHRQIDRRSIRAASALQDDWEKAERGPQAIDPAREYVDGGRPREPITEAQRKAVLRLNRAQRDLGADGTALVHEVLVLGLTMEQVGERRGLPASVGRTTSRDGFESVWIGWRWCTAFRPGKGRASSAERPCQLHLPDGYRTVNASGQAEHVSYSIGIQAVPSWCAGDQPLKLIRSELTNLRT